MNRPPIVIVSCQVAKSDRCCLCASPAGKVPGILAPAAQHNYHTAYPVPVGIIKAVEVEAGLALPKDAMIKVSK